MIENREDHTFVWPQNPWRWWGSVQNGVMEEKTWHILEKMRHILWQQDEAIQFNSGSINKDTQSKLETHQDFSQCKVECDTLNWWNSSESLFSRAMISSIYTSRQGIKPRENSITCTRLQNGVAKNTLKGWRILLNYKKTWGIPVWWYALKRWTICKT